MRRCLYTLCLTLGMPLIVARLYWRSRKARGYRENWLSRFGFFKGPAQTGGIWFHAVSMGEVIAAVPLIKAIQQRYPDLPITVTSTTPTGRAQVMKQLGERVFFVYAPYDLPGAVKRFLDRTRPQLAVFIETELWPNIFAICEKRHIPIMVANARLSEKSAKRYLRLAKLTKQMVQRIHTLAVQNSEDAARFVRLGVPQKHLTVTGSVKYDLHIPTEVREAGKALRAQLGAHRPIWVAASTHEGEETEILSAFQVIKQEAPDALLILVPRHPERFDSVAELVKKNGFRLARRTAPQLAYDEVDVFLGDTMGEMLIFCGASDVAFVGGSLIERGGHNPLEPAALGLPVITGPHTFNFAVVNRLLVKAHALKVIDNKEALAATVTQFFKDESERVAYGTAGKQVVEDNRGALEAHVALIGELIRP